MNSILRDYNDSDTMLIVFSGLGITYPPSFLFTGTLKKLNFNYNKLFIRDLDRNWYFNGIAGHTTDLKENVIFLMKEIVKTKSKRVITLGVSSGGFAAILYGHLINADSIISFSPQTFLDDKNCKKYNDNRFTDRDYFIKMKTRITPDIEKYLNLKNILPIMSTCYLIYGYTNTCNIDMHHVENVRSKNTKIYPIRVPDIKEFNKGHRLTMYLKKIRKLDRILENIFIKELNRKKSLNQILKVFFKKKLLKSR
jgi:hypothetical protein